MTRDLPPRYPSIRVTLRSRNPFALVSAVRHALRRAGTARDEVDRFSQEALTSASPKRVAEICRRWVAVDPAA
jgi:hypothetical protein